MQKRMKGNTLRFQLLPLRETSSQGASNTDSNNDDKGPLWLGAFLLVILITKYVLLKKYYLVKEDSELKACSKKSSDSVHRESYDSIWWLYLFLI